MFFQKFNVFKRVREYKIFVFVSKSAVILK